MGRDLLRGEILTIEQMKKGADGLILFILFLVMSAGNALADQNRPMRQIPPSAPFSILSSVFDPPPSSSLLSEYTLNQPLTQHYIAHYSTPGGIAYLNSVMDRAYMYMPFIKEEIIKRNLPLELAFLPVIESSFVITARSRSGAVGLWQFMLNSISPFNIKADDFIDERRDFIKSTRGALQKLDENYRTLGSWELALAAYNAGLGAITRIIQRTGVSDYWELSRMGELKGETLNYVPKLYAASYILSQPRRFGINIWQEQFEWIAIPLDRQISLDILAAESGVSREIFRLLNAELLHGISPIDKNYYLKVPKDKLEQIVQVLEREDLKLLRFHYHQVRHGDTLWSMTRHYDVTLALIEQHNPGISARYLRIGETVIIPAFKDIMPPSRPVSTGSFQGQHIVQRGDTLWSLGIRYRIDPQIIAEENGFELNSILREGRVLKVPILE